MNRFILFIFFSCLQQSFFSLPQYTSNKEPYQYDDKNPPFVKDEFLQANLSNMQVSDFFGKKININLIKRLLAVNEQQLLDGFEHRPGVQEWIGEHAGKFLNAAINTYYVTHNILLKQKIDRVAKKLIATQEPDGYLGTYLPAQRWTSWDVWVHSYDLIGLLDYYKLTKDNSSLAATEKIANLLCKTFGQEPGQRDINTAGEHVGMAATCVLDPFTDLYQLTHKEEYLDFCNYIIKAIELHNGPHIISALTGKKPVDSIADGKAYEMLSNLLGILKLYKINGNEILLNAVTNAWNDITEHRLYITGTASSFEIFTHDNQLKAEVKDDMGEGCVTVTWMQLNWELFKLTANNKYMEQIDRTMYNSLPAAENPQNGCVSYYTALNGLKPYACDITCCASSIPRGIAMIPYFFYGKKNNSPCILEMASFNIKDTLLINHKKIAIQIASSSQIPLNGKTKIILRLEQNEKFPLQIRVPEWCADFKIHDGENTWQGKSGTFFTINREWKKQNEITIECELPVKIISGDSTYNRCFAIIRGPQVLAIDSYFNPGFWHTMNIPSQNNLFLKDANKNLPPNWIGKQAYMLNDDMKIFLIPYADAGQLNAPVRVWIQYD